MMKSISIAFALLLHIAVAFGQKHTRARLTFGWSAADGYVFGTAACSQQLQPHVYLVK